MALQNEVNALVAQARLAGTDTVAVEIKKAEGGAPKSLPQTISAFANGGGGLIVLGLDEANGFIPVSIKADALAEALVTACADRVEPAIRAHIEIVQIDDMPLVAASIPPCDPKRRPCYVKTQGIENGSYIRAHDGDRHLTSYEIHLLVSGRGQPQDDAEPVAGATVADLNQDAVNHLVERFRITRGPAFSRAETPDILRMAGVCPRGGDSDQVTLAGLFALGVYPQEFFPQLNVTFVSYPTADARPMADGTRFLENISIDGSIPEMVSRLVEAVIRSMTRRSVMTGIGREDVWEYPPEAIRELIVNALMHRDYHPLAQGTQVRVELYPDKLVFINPGGLYGAASPQDLLTGRTSSSRNAILARLLEDVEIPGTNRTVCENRGSGIRLVNAELAANGLQPPIFRPSVSVFVAELQSARVGDKQPTNSEHAGASLVNDVDSRILSALSTGPKANQELQIIIGLGRPAISRRLQKLEEQGLIAPTTNRRSRNVKWQSTT